MFSQNFSTEFPSHFFDSCDIYKYPPPSLISKNDLKILIISQKFKLHSLTIVCRTKFRSSCYHLVSRTINYDFLWIYEEVTTDFGIGHIKNFHNFDFAPTLQKTFWVKNRDFMVGSISSTENWCVTFQSLVCKRRPGFLDVG